LLSVLMNALEPILFCWSGGKDSAMALHALLQQKQFRIVSLSHGDGNLRPHRHARPSAANLSSARPNPSASRSTKFLSSAVRQSHLRSAHGRSPPPLLQPRRSPSRFGDIFLEDLRAYREKSRRIGMTALFPIWQRDTRELIIFFICNASVPSLRASIPNLDPALPAANSMNPSSAIFRPTPTRA